MQKLYVLDTNVLLYDPYSIFHFHNSLIVIPIFVVEEIDKFKKEGSERGKSSRFVIKLLDQLGSQGSLKEGVKAENGTIIQISCLPFCEFEHSILDSTIYDNKILLTVLFLKKHGHDVCFVSKDVNARVKANVLGISVEDYSKNVFVRDEFYKGWTTLKVPAVQLKKDIPDDLIEFAKIYELTMNEFILIESNHNPFNYKIFRYIGGSKQFKIVNSPSLKWNIQPKNPQQIMAFDLLLDDSISCITLLGKAGTGKTFLALVAGLDMVLKKKDFQKVVVTRPSVPLGRDLGFLPGDMSEKLHVWMQPVYDNVDVILHSSSTTQHLNVIENENDFSSKKNNYKNKKDKKDSLQITKNAKSTQDLVNDGTIKFEAITYMRGRSLSYQFIIVDEVQNLSPHEVKTIISRVGQGSKVILCGDPYQIDAPYLDFKSNGLIAASLAFAGQSIFGTLFLEKSERSELSRLASELM